MWWHYLYSHQHGGRGRRLSSFESVPGSIGRSSRPGSQETKPDQSCNKRQLAPKLVCLYIKMYLLFFLKFLLRLLNFKLWQPYLTNVLKTDQNAWPQVHASDQNCLATGACTWSKLLGMGACIWSKCMATGACIWSKYLAINECKCCSKCQTRGWKFTASWYYRRLLSSVQHLENSSEYPLVRFKL